MDESTDTREEEPAGAPPVGAPAGEAVDPPPEAGLETPAAEGDAEVDAEEAAACVEAILFASDVPLRASRISLVGQLPPRAVRRAVEELNRRYEQIGAAFHIEEIAGGFQMLTRPEFHDIVGRLFESKKETRLSQAAMETLAIVAYRQPILRADVEAIRGVSCGEVLRGLMERQLVKIVGRAEVIGRPMLYGTTRKFLEVFGLKSLDDLPKVEELRGGAAREDAPAPPEEPDEENPPAADEGHEDRQEPRPAVAAADESPAQEQ